ncbi:MAG: hypothetical protein KBA66_04615 [Leptospiraceae bacterium]|nr:hypothetical protein [Leptospiraceae bacterium]
MTIQEMEVKKVKLISQIVNLYEDDLLNQIELMISQILAPIPISEWEKKELDKGLEDIKNGNLISHEEVQKEIQSLFRK